MDQSASQGTSYWKKCSVCKKEIGFDTLYQVCSVSTCQNKRTGLTFCSVECWDSHLGFANHRSSAAEERRSPSKGAAFRETEATAASPAPRRIIARSEVPTTSSKKIKTDTLIVVSKVKALIKEQSGFNTSQCAIDALTEKVIDECRKGIDTARRSERKTVMGRDIE